MIAAILAFFGTFLGKSLLLALGVTGLGMLRETAWYKAARAGWGKLCYKGGVVLSKLGSTRLGTLWQPAEEFLLDFAGFGLEQVFAGLRSDNVEKTIDQLERLRDVGSKTRSDALANKVTSQLHLLREPVSNPGQDFQDAVAAHKAGKDSIQNHLES